MADGNRRRVALVLAGLDARTAAPPGIRSAEFAAACLADSYELLADLEEVHSGIAGTGAAGTDEITDLLWPGALRPEEGNSLRLLADELAGGADELVVVPAAVPDLPGLVIAKVFKALNRADVCLAPERGHSGGWVAFGVRLPWPGWLPADLELDEDQLQDRLTALAPRRGALAIGPDWHRMRSPDSIHRLDPRLEGWESTRALLSGSSLSGGQPG